ncbi:unnamed protein product [Euphydryas editha]|uniref:Uncharacterized protein n=1 Tax=Euphydryas editha TaxID=104508 RepID=A0AAU9V999_EUPED|nr:unnamed protein product [Euphydryas editha]
MNTSFAHLGNEECKLCESYKLHEVTCKDIKECSENFCRIVATPLSIKWPDSITNKMPSNSYITKWRRFFQVYFSAELQKVVPRLDIIKIAIFCPRIIAFNESFVPLAQAKKKLNAVLWYEGVSRRKKEDIISAYRYFFFESKRDCTEITI